MTTRITCPDCGVGIGEKHINECEVERCSGCGQQRITCDCTGHDLSKSVWTGEWPTPKSDNAATGDLQHLFQAIPPGEVPDIGIDRLLAARWEELDGSEKGGMEGYKLINRMEQMRWEPPILTFVLERHGGTECGSTRAELQHWSVDFGEMTAEITKTGYRQLYAVAARTSIKSMAAEIVQQILNSDDDRIQWLEDGSVKVLASSLFPADSGFKRTVEGRRQRLCGYIGDVLNDNGWEKLRWNRFRKNNIAHS